ncbi:MAG: RagB/SusD family nutrient uptake outer membrane protein [Dysgonamonadaceae bacterium]|nr:RagB/SusD family nutrient uptake outer membrane protein [Dysgonamonadaceae bacterium]
MKHLKYIVILLCTLSVTCSCDYLSVDKYFDETLRYDSVFSNKLNLEKYVWGTAAMLPDPGAFWGNNFTPGIFACDEAMISGPLSEYRGMDYVLGAVSPDNNLFSSVWLDMYKVIRKANTILARMEEVPDLTSFEKMELMGYAYMLRAYAYYLILMDYGPVVILGNDILETNREPEYYDRSRATYDESVDYICQEFENAAKYLPTQVSSAYFGRPTKGAAYAMIARLRLQQASPLYNGGTASHTYFGDWTRSVDGEHYVSQNYSEEKWAIAAAAAKRVIDMGRYVLHTVPIDPTLSDAIDLPANVPTTNFPNGAGGIDPFRSYSDMFTGEVLMQRNAEVIWGSVSPSTLNYTRHSFPYNAMGGWNQVAVNQKIIDAYYMADGGTVSESGPYFTYNTVSTPDMVFSGYTLKNTVHPMFVNREMRFYASIGFSGRYWTASSTTETNRKEMVINYNYSGNGGIGVLSGGSAPTHYPVTGYGVTKYIHSDDAWAGTGYQQMPKSFPIIRYAEILLSYVEAINNLSTSYTFSDEESGTSVTVSRDVEEMAKYFNQIHYRVGLPGLSDTQLASVSEMQKIIEKERMIELAFENRRYYDVRRWGIYEESENERWMGLDMFSDPPSFYNIVPVDHVRARSRVVNKRMVLLPLTRSEVRKAPSLDQNPGWGD